MQSWRALRAGGSAFCAVILALLAPVTVLAQPSSSQPASDQTAQPTTTDSLAILPGPPTSQPPPGWVAEDTPDTRIWPWLETDETPDPAIRYGRLDNGMRYAIRVNNLPEEAVSLRFQIEVGSINEEDSQRGYAHLLEHMAFNGSTNIPEGELTRRMERLGAAFGSHVNASTGLRETNYMLDLPRAGDGRLELALNIFRETANRLLLDQAAIDREKGVVANEAADSDNAARRLAEERQLAIYPNRRSTYRWPIGLPEVIANATSSSLRAFYQRWYRPDRTILVVTGAVDLDATEALIRATYGDWRPALNEPNPPRQNGGTWEPNRAFAFIQTNSELPESFSISAERPDPTIYSLRSNADTDRSAYGRFAAEALLGQRLRRRGEADDQPFTFASYGHGRTRDAGWSGTVSFMPRDGNWQAGLDAVTGELRLALTNGFTQVELDEYMANIREGSRLAVAQSATRLTAGLAGEIISDLSSDSVTQTQEARHAEVEAILATLTLADVNAALRYFWQGIEPRFEVMTRTEGLTEGAIFDAWRAALAKPLPTGELYEVVRFVPPTVGPPGRVLRSWREEAIDTDFVLFENGVTLAFKKTGFSRENVSVEVTLGAGHMDFDSETELWAVIAGIAWSADGFGNLPLQDVPRAFVGRTSGPAGVSLGAYSASLTAAPAARDLAEQLQVMLSQTLEPRLGPTGPTQFRSILPQFWTMQGLTAASAFSFNAGAFYLTGAQRFEIPELDELLANDDAAGNARLRQVLAQAPIMVTIVGDTDLATAQAAVAATYGALPPRTGLSAGQAVSTADWRATQTGGPPRVLHHQGPDTQALVHVAWPNRDVSDRQTSWMLSALAGVMQLRATAEIREAAGQSYSPDARSQGTSDELNLERLTMTATVLPADVEAIEAVMMKIAADLARDGPTADEMKRAIDPVIEARARARQNNGYWLTQLSGQILPLRPHQDPVPLWHYDGQFENYWRSFTPAQLQALAQRYLTPDNALRIRVVPGPANPPAGAN